MITKTLLRGIIAATLLLGAASLVPMSGAIAKTGLGLTGAHQTPAITDTAAYQRFAAATQKNVKQIGSERAGFQVIDVTTGGFLTKTRAVVTR